MDLDTFQALPVPEVAQLVRAGGVQAAVFPMNGTRRWFLVEHARLAEADVQTYLDVAARRHVEICQMMFAHGLPTLLMPTFSVHQQERGARYLPVVAQALSRLVSHPAYLDFYQAYGVRVRFYGDYRKYLADTPYAFLSDQFDAITAQTSGHDRHRIFYGMFAHDATEATAELAVRYYQAHGRIPDKRALVELYYGEYLPPVDMFIGFSKFRAFDFGLVATGREALYFTVSPSPYLTVPQWRDILYDYLYARRGPKLDYAALSPAERAEMQDFYRRNIGRTVGVGTRHAVGFWHPLPQVELPTLNEVDNVSDA